jgi:transposase
MRPMCRSTLYQEYSYAYGAVSPMDGRLDTLVLPEVNTECMQLFIIELSLRHIDENLVIIMDGAGWHKSKKLDLPENISIIFLPPYSPELNPIELVWAELKEKFLHNMVFESIDALEDQLVTGLLYYENNREITKSIVAWEWIVNISCI